MPASDMPSPALIVCHGALEFKENYFELCEFLADRAVAALAIDMHGHGESEGERFHVDMGQWVADIQAAIAFLDSHPGVDGRRIGAFGLSSGGTAILEAAWLEPKLKALIALAATVKNVAGFTETLLFRALVLLGTVKRMLTKRGLRISMLRMARRRPFASDPEVNRVITNDPHFIEAYSSFPFPGASQYLFVDTIKRVGGIAAPTLVLHGEDDRLDPVDTALALYHALTCQKEVRIIPDSGHVAHMDRHKDHVMELTANWALEHLT